MKLPVSFRAILKRLYPFAVCTVKNVLNLDEYEPTIFDKNLWGTCLKMALVKFILLTNELQYYLS